ncbi:hypothetical protein SAMN06265360_1662 [Haloechinothrix alba]|uniref:Uncharacterized protein n=1 Tax=Haloechinothrix alba TaxID=664784 RepID=A0A239AXV1_9PSEU|nr:hypothetical protein [Haloechinothrix alba]SNR99808.1 hypothetical protein SAMN06265360_1662 [Haloechinothrix alba]
MVLVVLIVAAAACAVAAWIGDSLLLAYIAFVLAGLCVLVLAVAAWKRHRAGQATTVEATSSEEGSSGAGGTEADVSVADGSATAGSGGVPVSSQDELADEELSASTAIRDAKARTPTAAASAGEYDEPAPAATAHPAQAAAVPDSGTASGDEGRGAGKSDVCIVPGRKRFHQADCQLLAGHQQERLTLVEALEEGFTACSVCSPDANGSAHSAAE